MIASPRRKAAPSTSPGRRRGLISVAALIGLIIIGIVCAGLLKVALARRSEVSVEERRLQSVWLAQSGLDRARARLASAPDYAGETWEVPASDLGGRGSGRVEIRVEAVADQPDRRKVRVQADYPTESSLRSRQSRKVIVPLLPAR